MSIGTEGEKARRTPRLLGGRLEVPVTEHCGGVHACVHACMGGGDQEFVHVKFEVPIRNLTEMQS